MMSHDARDTNNDGKVSLMEKVKDKLHLHHKDKDTDYTKHSSTLPTSTASHSSGIDLNHDGRISTGEKLAGSGLAGSGLAGSGLAGSGLAGAGLASSGLTGSNRLQSGGMDLNHDGRISTGEKLAGGLTGSHSSMTSSQSSMTSSQSSMTGSHSSGLDLNHDGRISTGEKLAGAGLAGSGLAGSSGFHDSRDLNRDGHVSMGEKLTTGSSGFHDSRDLNRDGHISTSERLATGSGFSGASGTHDSRDLNRDGHLSMGERLGHGGSGLHEDATRLRLHEEQLAVSKREALAGEVGIHKRVHEEHVQETVPLRREEVFIERRPLSGVAEPGARIAAQDEVIRVPLFREELVTEKRIVPTEEVIVRKKEVVENQVIGATLRSEFVETRQVQSGAFDARDTNRDGHLSMGEKLKGDLHHNSGAFDARDTNRDGHVSMGEKLKGNSVHSNAGALDGRDTNRDGHVSMGEKLKSADLRDSAYDARDTNLDGRVSGAEKLKDTVGMNPATKAARG